MFNGHFVSIRIYQTRSFLFPLIVEGAKQWPRDLEGMNKQMKFRSPYHPPLAYKLYGRRTSFTHLCIHPSIHSRQGLAMLPRLIWYCVVQTEFYLLIILPLQLQLLGYRYVPPRLTRNQILCEAHVYRTTLILKFQDKQSVSLSSTEMNWGEINLEGLSWRENGKKGHSGSKLGWKRGNMAVLANLSSHQQPWKQRLICGVWAFSLWREVRTIRGVEAGDEAIGQQKRRCFDLTRCAGRRLLMSYTQ